MLEIIRMLVVLTLISGTTGLALGYVNKITTEPIIQAEFINAKAPALNEVLPDYDNDLVKDSFVLKREDGTEVTVYPAKKGGELLAVGFETSAKGFGGDIRLMVGVDVAKKTLLGIGVVAQSETPGMGARIEEAAFKKQFAKEYPLGGKLAVKADGGEIDAVSGATISSRAACAAVNAGLEFYAKNEEKMKNQGK